MKLQRSFLYFAAFILHCNLLVSGVEALADQGQITNENTNDEITLSNSSYHPYTPRPRSVNFEFGDSLGGPVRFNTRFPSPSGIDDPPSHYHGLAFLIASYVESYRRGSLSLGIGVRRDLSRRTYQSRESVDQSQNRSYQAQKLSMKSELLSLGWIFGQEYREKPWRASILTEIDHTKLDAHYFAATGPEPLNDSDHKHLALELWSASLRGKIMFNLLLSRYAMISAGPSMSIPLASLKVASRNSGGTQEIDQDKLEFKTAAAASLSIEVSLL